MNNVWCAGQAARVAGGWRNTISISRTLRIWSPFSKSSYIAQARTLWKKMAQSTDASVRCSGAPRNSRTSHQIGNAKSSFPANGACWPLWIWRPDCVNIVKIIRGHRYRCKHSILYKQRRCPWQFVNCGFIIPFHFHHQIMRWCGHMLVLWILQVSIEKRAGAKCSGGGSARPFLKSRPGPIPWRQPATELVMTIPFLTSSFRVPT